MPFVMDQDVRPQNLKGDQEHPVDTSLPAKKPVVHTNGAVKSPGNGQLLHGVAATPPSIVNGHVVPARRPSKARDPPSLDQSWREHETYKSMGTMLYRLSQACFRDLNDTLGKMAEQPLQHTQANGTTSKTHDTDEGSLSKKRTFMDFASAQRDRFIKALVLSDWARNADDMGRLLDVIQFHRKQDINQLAGMDNIGYIKRELGVAKMPNPNIVGALELLGTGKASARIPDLDYLPHKKLTAKQLLRTLQDMNVTLATRLNLHEELPEHFRDFSIANGRATFRVQGEFEVELSVADEDVTSPLYFIDFRFSFRPAPNNLDERTRNTLEAQANKELSTKGLQGCFDFLHNFVLTHKINVLRDQFRTLLQEKWFDCARAENRGRLLAIQYWSGRPGRKSWLEIGVGTGKAQGSQSQKPPTAQLSIRWFRDGELVENPGLDIDWETIHLERIISSVVARHVSWTFETAKRNLETSNATTMISRRDSKLNVELTNSVARPEDCRLRLTLTSLPTPIDLRVEAISGRFSITPASLRSANIERRLNNDASAHVKLAEASSALLCGLAQDRVDKARQVVGWLPVLSNFRADNLKAQFGEYTTYRAYVCNEAWSGGWNLFATFALSGDKWWIARVEDRPSQTGSPATREIKDCRQLPVGDLTTANPVMSRLTLLQIEKLAVAEVSFAVLSQQLALENIPYRIEKTASLISSEGKGGDVLQPSIGLFFRGSPVLKDSFGKPLVIDCVRLTHRGVRVEQSDDQGVAEMNHEIRLTLDSGKFRHLREYLNKHTREADIATNESGALALRIRAPFGQPYIDQVIARIQACDRLDRYISLMQRHSYQPIVVHFSKIAFRYRADQDLSVAISFTGKDGTMPARLELKPTGSNPHQRIRVVMEQTINSPKTPDHISLVSTILDYSYFAMLAFEKIERADVEKRASSIHVRSPLHYIVVYKAPLPVLKISIQLRHKSKGNQKELVWNVTCGKTKQELQNSAFGKAWLEFLGPTTEQWSSPGDGSVISNPLGMEKLLVELDNVVRRFVTDDAVAKQETTDAADAKPQPTQKQQSAQQKPSQAPQQRTSTPQQKPGQQQKPAQQQQQQQQQQPQPQQRPNQPKSSAPRPNQPAPTANMMATPMGNNHSSRNNQPKPKKEIIELD